MGEGKGRRKKGGARKNCTRRDWKGDIYRESRYYRIKEENKMINEGINTCKIKDKHGVSDTAGEEVSKENKMI